MAEDHLPADDVGEDAAGEATYRGDFLANLLHEALFFELPPWVFTTVYTAFGVLVLATFVLAPPRRKRTDPERGAGL